MGYIMELMKKGGKMENVGEILAGLGVLLGGLAKLVKELRRKDDKTD